MITRIKNPTENFLYIIHGHVSLHTITTMHFMIFQCKITLFYCITTQQVYIVHNCFSAACHPVVDVALHQVV